MGLIVNRPSQKKRALPDIIFYRAYFIIYWFNCVRSILIPFSESNPRQYQLESSVQHMTII